MSPAQGPETALEIDSSTGGEASGAGHLPPGGQRGSAGGPAGGPGQAGASGSTAVSMDGAGAGEGEEGAARGAEGAERGGGRAPGEWGGKGEEGGRGGEGGGFQGASSFGAGCNLAVAIIGASIMGLPTTLKWMGMPLGIALIVGVGALTLIAIRILVKVTVVHGIWSFPGVVRKVCGDMARLVLDVSVAIFNFICCVIYLIAIGDLLFGALSGNGQFNPGLLVRAAGGAMGWWNSRPFLVGLATLLLVLPLTLLARIDSLQYSSAASLVAAAGIVVFLVVLAAVRGAQGQLHAPRLAPAVYSLDSAMAVTATIPILATAYTCNPSVHPTFRELKDRTVPNMSRITWWTIGGSGALYLTGAVAGYLLFGEDTAVDVLVNFNSGALSNGGGSLFTVTSIAVQILYCIHMVTVMPIMFFPLRLACNDLFFCASPRALDQDWPRFLGLTAGLLLLIYLVSVLIPNLWLAFNLLGATATLLLGFAFPALLALRDTSGSIAQWERAVSYLMLVLSAVTSVASLVSSLYFLILGHKRLWV